MSLIEDIKNMKSNAESVHYSFLFENGAPPYKSDANLDTSDCLIDKTLQSIMNDENIDNLIENK